MEGLNRNSGSAPRPSRVVNDANMRTSAFGSVTPISVHTLTGTTNCPACAMQHQVEVSDPWVARPPKEAASFDSPNPSVEVFHSCQPAARTILVAVRPIISSVFISTLQASRSARPGPRPIAQIGTLEIRGKHCGRFLEIARLQTLQP